MDYDFKRVQIKKQSFLIFQVFSYEHFEILGIFLLKEYMNEMDPPHFLRVTSALPTCYLRVTHKLHPHCQCSDVPLLI